MRTREEIAREWEEAFGCADPAERSANARKWIPYYSFLAGRQAGRPFDASADPDGVTAELESSGLIYPGCRVLDIGAGMGDRALRFAARGAEVTAVELCPACCDLMESRAGESGRVSVIRSAWEDFQAPEGSFDLVFASMCPAICGFEELLRMEALSRGSCAIVTVLPGSYDLRRREMMSELGIRPRGMVTPGDRYAEALEALGRDLSFSVRESRSERSVPAELILEQYPVYFSIFGINEERSREYLKDYLERKAAEGILKDGMLSDESFMRTVLISWKAPKD